MQWEGDGGNPLLEVGWSPAGVTGSSSARGLLAGCSRQRA